MQTHRFAARGDAGEEWDGVRNYQARNFMWKDMRPGDLALFSGAGSINLPMSATDLSSQSGASSWSIGPRAYASVSVTYNYQECTTPAEPTTWGRIKRNYR